MAVDAAVAVGEGALVGRERRGRRRPPFGRFFRQWNAVAGSCMLAVVLVCALFPKALQPQDPLRARLLSSKEAPSATHRLGTDVQGRDVLSRIIAGTRPSLLMGLIPVAIGLGIGGLLGMVAGYYTRLGDIVIMRLIDMMMAFPGIILALTIVAALGTRSGSNTGKAMVAIGVALIPTFARITRATVLSAKEYLYVDAARATGCSDGRIMFTHILPNVVAPLIVVGTLSIAGAILAGASLSFLGLGAKPPAIEWGSMINDGRAVLGTAWWISTFPGVAIMFTVIAINLLGDGVRDLLDPRLRH